MLERYDKIIFNDGQRFGDDGECVCNLDDFIFYMDLGSLDYFVLTDDLIMIFDLKLSRPLVHVLHCHLVLMVYGIIEKFSILAK